MTMYCHHATIPGYMHGVIESDEKREPRENLFNTQGLRSLHEVLEDSSCLNSGLSFFTYMMRMFWPLLVRSVFVSTAFGAIHMEEVSFETTSES